MEIFPEIHKATGAKLTIAYELERWLKAAENESHSGHRRAQKIKMQLAELQATNLPIEMTGHLPHRKFVELLGDTKVLAYPCDPISYTESFGLVVYEAMASGCSVILTDADSFPEQYGKLLNLIRLADPDWLATFTRRTVKALRSGSPQVKLIGPRSWEDHLKEVIEKIAEVRVEEKKERQAHSAP